MDIRDEIAKAALELAEKLRHNADIQLGETIAKIKEEAIESILLSKGYITLSEVLAILKPGWLPNGHEPVALDFDAADATTNKIMLDFNL